MLDRFKRKKKRQKIHRKSTKIFSSMGKRIMGFLDSPGRGRTRVLMNAAGELSKKLFTVGCRGSIAIRLPAGSYCLKRKNFSVSLGEIKNESTSILLFQV